MKFLEKNSDWLDKDRKNWADNPKSNFEYGLSITILSTKLGCNLEWEIQSRITLSVLQGLLFL